MCGAASIGYDTEKLYELLEGVSSWSNSLGAEWCLTTASLPLVMAHYQVRFQPGDDFGIGLRIQRYALFFSGYTHCVSLRNDIPQLSGGFFGPCTQEQGSGSDDHRDTAP